MGLESLHEGLMVSVVNSGILILEEDDVAGSRHSVAGGIFGRVGLSFFGGRAFGFAAVDS